MLQSGFTGDDAVNSVTFGKSGLRETGSTLGEAILHTQMGSFALGRIFPLSAPTVFVPLYLADGNVRAFKVYIMAMVLLNVALFGYFVRRFSRSATIGFMAMLWLPLLIQFRANVFHDPVLGFGGHLQAVTTMILVSLIALLGYLNGGKRWQLVASVAAYGVAVLTYEVALPLGLLHLLTIWLYPQPRPFPKAARAWLPFGALAGLITMVVVTLRLLNRTALVGTMEQYVGTLAAGADPSAGAYTMNFSILPMLTLLAKQMVGATPLSYLVTYRSLDFQELREYASTGLSIAPLASYVVIFGFLAAIGLIGRHALLEGPRTLTTANLPRVFAVGAVLLLLPNVMIALSPRYQLEVEWGLAYLPVYMSYFGSALLLAGLVRLLYVTLGRHHAPAAVVTAFSVVLALAFAGLGQTNHSANLDDVMQTNVNYLYPRELMVSAAHKGLFSEMPPDAELLRGNPSAWENSTFYSVLAGREIAFVRWIQEDSPAKEGQYLLLSHVAAQGNGAVILGRITEFAPDGTSVVLDSIRLYVAANPATGFATLRNASPGEIGLDDVGFKTVRADVHTGLFQSAPDYEVIVDL